MYFFITIAVKDGLAGEGIERGLWRRDENGESVTQR